MKTFLDTPDDIHPADKIGWVLGYNQCLADHEYMNTNAHLQAKLSVAADRIDELEKQVARLKTVPMKYRRMEFNAQLQKELEAKQARIDELMMEYCPNEMTPRTVEEL